MDKKKKTAIVSDDRKSRPNDKIKRGVLSVIVGLLCGFVNGFFGGGGGMIVVPMLEKVFSRSEKIAHATAIAIILPITILSGFLSVFKFGCDRSVLAFVTVGSAVGGVIGALFLKKAKPTVINFLFLVLMAAAGVRLAFF